MVSDEKINGSIQPINKPITTLASSILISCNQTSSAKATKRDRAANAAAPMANHFVTAFVVLPTASSASVVSLTVSERPDISAIPHALSVIGPNESTDTMMPVIEIIANAAIAIP